LEVAFFFGFFLVSLGPADQLLRLLFRAPDTDGPIVRASEENRVINFMPERITPNLIDRASMAMEHLHILLRVAHLALKNSTVLGRAKVINPLAVVREINTETTSVDKIRRA
jgi:hypothetical protein